MISYQLDAILHHPPCSACAAPAIPAHDDPRQRPLGLGHLPAPLRPLPPSALRLGILVEIRPLLAPSAALYCPVTMPLLNSPSYSVDPGYSCKDTAGMSWIQYRKSGMAGTVSRDVDGRVDMRLAVPIDGGGTYCNRKLLVIPTCFGLKKLLYCSKIRKILTFTLHPLGRSWRSTPNTGHPAARTAGVPALYAS